MTVASNIRRLRSVYDLKQRELADIAGVTDRAVSSWETGVTEPRMGHVQRLSDYFGIPKSAIIEEGGMLALDPATRKYTARPTRTTAPLYAAIAAGTPREEIEISGEVPVPEQVLADHPKAFFLTVSGQSMNRVLPDGSYALIDPDDEVANGDACALLVNAHDACIKRYHRSASTVVLEPDSYDPKYKPLIFDYSKPGTDTVQLIGRVVWFVAPYGERL